MPLGASLFEDVPLEEFIYLAFTRTPGGVTVGDSGLCCYVPCLSSAIISLCLMDLRKGCEKTAGTCYMISFCLLYLLYVSGAPRIVCTRFA